MESNLTKSVREKPIYLKQLFENYSNSLSDYYQIEDEIPWDMLNSLSYVNSISSTTGMLAIHTTSKKSSHILLSDVESKKF